MGKTSLQKTSDILATTIHKIWTEGAWLMPTGGNNGKRPLLKFSQKTRHSLNLITQTLEHANSQTYGIRLRDIVVLDIDNKDTDLIDEMHERFGRTDCMVKTGRGFHLYYSTNKKITANLRATGLPIDLKQGANAFVLAPIHYAQMVCFMNTTKNHFHLAIYRALDRIPSLRSPPSLV